MFFAESNLQKATVSASLEKCTGAASIFFVSTNFSATAKLLTT
jgi:hypothetical protein